jgi:hypothetical protein
MELHRFVIEDWSEMLIHQNSGDIYGSVDGRIRLKYMGKKFLRFLKDPKCSITTVTISRFSANAFLTMLANGDFPSIKRLYLWHIRDNNDALLNLIRSPHSSITYLCPHNGHMLPHGHLHHEYDALSTPHTRVRTYWCDYGADYTALCQKINHLMTGHRVRDKLFLLTRVVCRDILRELYSYLV